MSDSVFYNPDDRPYHFTIFFTGSVRGKMLPMIEGSNMACTIEQTKDETVDCQGGCAFRLAYRDYIANNLDLFKSSRLLTVDTGSYWWGSLFDYEIAAQCINATSYDSLGLGYTDFFEGTETLSKFINKLDTKIQVISTNTTPVCDEFLCVNRLDGNKDACKIGTPACPFTQSFSTEDQEDQPIHVETMNIDEDVSEKSTESTESTNQPQRIPTVTSPFVSVDMNSSLKNVVSRNLKENMYSSYNILRISELEPDQDSDQETPPYNFVALVSFVMDSTFAMPKAFPIVPADPDLRSYLARLLVTIDEARLAIREMEEAENLPISDDAPIIFISDLPHSDAKVVVRSVRGIVAVLCNDWGYSGYYVVKNYYNENVIIASIPENGIQVGVLHLRLEKKRNVVAYDGKLVRMTREASHYAESAKAKAMQERVIEVAEETKERLKNVVGSSDTFLSAARGTTNLDNGFPTIDTTGCREYDCALGRMVVDAYRVACLPYIGQLCDIGFVNTGAFRDHIPKGDVTIGDIEGLLPFRNSIVVMQIQGSQILEAVANGVRHIFALQLSGAFPQSNLLLAFNPNSDVQPLSDRVVEVRFPRDYKAPPHLQWAVDEYNNVYNSLQTDLPPYAEQMFAGDSLDDQNRTIKSHKFSPWKPKVDPDQFFNLIRNSTKKNTTVVKKSDKFESQESQAVSSSNTPNGIGGQMFGLSDSFLKDEEDDQSELPTINPKASYWMSVPHFLFSGGDTYSSLMDPFISIIAKDETSVVQDYMSHFKEESYIGLKRETLERCLANELPWATVKEKDCYTIMTDLTASTAVFCETNAKFCATEAKAIAEKYSIPFDEACECSGLGVCSRRICTCNMSEDPLYSTLPMVFDSRCSTIRSIETVTNLTRMVVLPTFGFVAFVCVTFAILLLRFRKRRIIRAVSPKLAIVMCFGSLLTACSAFFDIFEPSPWACTAAMWFLNVGFTLTFAPLFFRVYRIHRIFNVNMNSNARRKVHTDPQLLQRVGMLVGANIVLLTTLAATAPVSLQLYDISSSTAIQGLIKCTSKNNALVISFLVLNAPLLIWGTYLAIKTRRVEANYNESSYISMSVYNCVGFIVISTSLYLTLIGSLPEAAQILKCVTILYVTLFTLCIVYLPRFLKLIRESSEASQQETSFLANSVQLVENAYNRSNSKIPQSDDDTPGKDLTTLEDDGLVSYIRILEGFLYDYGIALPDEVEGTPLASLPPRSGQNSRNGSSGSGNKTGSSTANKILVKPKREGFQVLESDAKVDADPRAQLNGSEPSESSTVLYADDDNASAAASSPLVPEEPFTKAVKKDDKRKSMFAGSSLYATRK